MCIVHEKYCQGILGYYDSVLLKVMRASRLLTQVLERV